MYNLSTLLEDSARQLPRPRRRRPRRHPADLRPGQRAPPTRSRTCWSSRGIQPGDKVALSCPNLPYFPIVYYGILKAGATVVPLNVLLKGREVAYHLDDSDAKAYFCFQGTAELPIGAGGARRLRGRPTGCEHFFVITADPAAASPIEGTETLGRRWPGQSADVRDRGHRRGRHRGHPLHLGHHRAAQGRRAAAPQHARQRARRRPTCSGPTRTGPTRYLCVLPLFHSFGQTVIQNGAFAFGGTVVMLPRFEAHAALALMAKEEVTFFAGVPTMYWGLLGALDDSVDVKQLAANLRVAASGGAALPVEVHKDFQKKFGVTILEGYGLSETSPVASFSPYGEDVRVGSIGVPIPGVEMKLLQPDSWEEIDFGEDPEHAVGEIAIKGHNIMKGYYNRPDATAEVIHDGWFRSGDLGRRDEDGWYYIVDRSKDMIIRGGFNVYPREIEEVLLTHPDVSLAAVIGVPHESHGEEIQAYVILNDGASVTAEELVAWGKEQMANYKYPRQSRS